jgi:hypothetical protein
MLVLTSVYKYSIMIVSSSTLCNNWNPCYFLKWQRGWMVKLFIWYHSCITFFFLYNTPCLYTLYDIFGHKKYVTPLFMEQHERDTVTVIWILLLVFLYSTISPFLFCVQFRILRWKKQTSKYHYIKPSL